MQLTNKSKTKSTKRVKLTLQAPACNQSHPKTCNIFGREKQAYRQDTQCATAVDIGCNTLAKDHPHSQTDTAAADPTLLKTDRTA